MYFFLNHNLFLLLDQLITSDFPFIIWITRQSKQVYFRGWNTKKATATDRISVGGGGCMGRVPLTT